MQKEKIDIHLYKYWKFITYHNLRVHKSIEWHARVIEKFLSLFNISENKNGLLKKIIPYIFSGFSIIFIGYLIMNILNNYPPRVIGISP
jgi:hypothetical protein